MNLALLLARIGTAHRNVQSDPLFSSVVAGLHFNDVNNSTTFTDVKGNTFTAFGSSVISTAQSQFGGSSLYCPNDTSGIWTPDGSQWNRGTSEWCIDFWIYPTSNAADMEVYCHRASGAGSNFEFIRRQTDGRIRFYANNGSTLIDRTSTGAAAINTQTYVRVQRRLVSGNLVVEIAIGGTYGQTGTDSAAGSIPDFAAKYCIGAGDDGSGGSGMIGYIDDWRDAIGQARDAGTNFTPPTTPFPNQ